MTIKSYIRTIPHYPKQGVMYRDITTLLKDSVSFRATINELVNRYTGAKIDVVAAVEARGFIIGAALAFQLGVGFVPIRKKGKLPAETVGQDYELEYGTDRIEMHVDAVSKGAYVLLVDDLIATGGTGVTGRDVTPEAFHSVYEKEIPGFGELFRMLSYEKIGTSTLQSRATGGLAGGTYLFALPGSPGACKDGWDGILQYQLDYRQKPCNLVELMPRLNEHQTRGSL